MPDLSAAQFQLLQGAQLFAPEDRGTCDVLVANGKIIAVDSHIPPDTVPDCALIPLHGRVLCPGFIDQHVHLIGGGGEAGPTTRTPEVTLSRLTEAGITTVVGLLGTDAVTRHPESLLAKTRALNEEGITAWMLTGAYHVPSPTITGSVEKDVALLDRVLGVKCAVSDHRSSAPDAWRLASMAAESRVGGLLGGKPGVSVFHMGSSKKGLQPLYDILENSDVPIGKLLPTHVNRSETLFEQAIAFAHRGGVMDITSGIPGPVTPADGIARAVSAGVPLARITLSSDGNGSQPLFDAAGNLTGIGVAGFASLLETLQILVQRHGFTLTDALRPLTTSVAAFLGLSTKGEIAPGYDADLLVLTPELRIEQVFARGKRMVEDGKACVKGTFESV
ncbi:beta-aspartyl-peptidase [[Enterobacter] lignolyticus]|uniref:Isoaspartyl dipeptidase n=1 Tax=[Enterobacter] lignolyticus TaxID=1334193 RepID=A0A806X7Q6_9ENTR|nr:beta-aspartyl-peptidase [[Enterobacter] lignolyticus]ALR74817.1 isoaspartyl dipeptidase [[Enterobacter] lignolyticus]